MTMPTELSPRQIDAAVTVLVVVAAVLGLIFDGGTSTDPSALVTVVALAAAASVAFRRRNPIAVLVVIALARIVVMVEMEAEHVLLPAAVVVLFTLARHGRRRTGVVVASCVGLVTAVVIAALNVDPIATELFPELAFVAVPIAVGDAVRSRGDRLRQFVDSEADARVQAERLRIARDLHDVVAHGLSTIAIQSGVAAHLLDRDPEQAKQALEVINATGKSSLEELRAMVGVLRSTDDVPLRPTPSDPNDLSDLLGSAEHIGIDVTVEQTGSFPADVGDSCVVAMHRIIQEALTNVARHAGPVDCTLTISHRDDRVELCVKNMVGGEPDSSLESTGVGIIGMRERAESLGGTLTAAPTTEGRFEVRAILPYPTRREGAA